MSFLKKPKHCSTIQKHLFRDRSVEDLLDNISPEDQEEIDRMMEAATKRVSGKYGYLVKQYQATGSHVMFRVLFKRLIIPEDEVNLQVNMKVLMI